MRSRHSWSFKAKVLLITVDHHCAIHIHHDFSETLNPQELMSIGVVMPF